MPALPSFVLRLTPTKMKEPKLPTARDLIAKIIPNQANFEHCGKHRTINGSLLLDIERAIESHTQAHTDGLRGRVKELESVIQNAIEAWDEDNEPGRKHFSKSEIQRWLIDTMHPAINKLWEAIK